MKKIIYYFFIVTFVVLLIAGISDKKLIYDTTYIVAIATFLLALVGYQQLSKIHDTNSLQLLFHLEEEWVSQAMRDKRKILSQELLKYLNGKNIETIEDQEWHKMQNIVEDVIDCFEKIGYVTKEGTFSLNTVYQMYSDYVQGYWELCLKSGYIQKIRNMPNGKDYYDQTEWLYKILKRKYDIKELNGEELKEFCLAEL